MFRGILILLQAMLMTLFLLGGIGCSGEEVDSGSIINPSEPEPEPELEPEPPVDTTPVGEVEDTGFWVNVQSDQYDVTIDKSTEYGSDCFIDKDTTGSEYLTCYVDIMEAHLYMHDIEMQYNAPPGLCDNVVIFPAWYWNQGIGTGPTSVEVDVDSSGPLPVVTSCTANHDQLGDIACNTHPELFDVDNTAGPRCIYDQSDTDGKTNCCLGTYDLTINTNDGMAITTSFTPGTEWGGDPAACFSPYLSNGWGHFRTNGLPAGQVQPVPRDPTSENPAGLNDAINLGANLTTTNVRASTWANFFALAGSPHAHDGYYAAITSNLPYAVEPIDDLTGSPVGSGIDAWYFQCRDEAFEVKHQIRVFIREWNTLADYVAYHTTEGVTYNPDQAGVEGTNCDYDGIFDPDSPLADPDAMVPHNPNCNDFADLDDYVNAVGTYDTNDAITPAADPDAVDAIRRELYFPNIIYE